MEDNKLLAEFMGNPTIFNTIHDATLYQVKEQGNMTYHVDELQYHSSWDWLMIVVQNIEQDCEGVPKEMININLYSDINEVYEAVVEFIKNQNN